VQWRVHFKMIRYWSWWFKRTICIFARLWISRLYGYLSEERQVMYYDSMNWHGLNFFIVYFFQFTSTVISNCSHRLSTSSFRKVMVFTSPFNCTNPGLAPGGLLTFLARVILTLITDWPMHLTCRLWHPLQRVMRHPCKAWREIRDNLMRGTTDEIPIDVPARGIEHHCLWLDCRPLYGEKMKH
jgi:hypothetical protein